MLLQAVGHNVVLNQSSHLCPDEELIRHFRLSLVCNETVAVCFLWLPTSLLCAITVNLSSLCKFLGA